MENGNEIFRNCNIGYYPTIFDKIEDKRTMMSVKYVDDLVAHPSVSEKIIETV
jgi:hypothetical protein